MAFLATIPHAARAGIVAKRRITYAAYNFICPHHNELHLLVSLKNEQKLTPDLVLRDPFGLDFLNLKDTYSEKDLESSILVELQKLIIELGSDYAFLARQKRISIDNDDYYIDLLFYHRRLKSLVEFRFENETVWLTQDQMSLLFDKAKSTISEHIKHIFEEGELDEKVVIRNFRITTQHGAINSKIDTFPKSVSRLISKTWLSFFYG